MRRRKKVRLEAKKNGAHERNGKGSYKDGRASRYPPLAVIPSSMHFSKHSKDTVARDGTAANPVKIDDEGDVDGQDTQNKPKYWPIFAKASQGTALQLHPARKTLHDTKPADTSHDARTKVKPLSTRPALSCSYCARLGYTGSKVNHYRQSCHRESKHVAEKRRQQVRPTKPANGHADSSTAGLRIGSHGVKAAKEKQVAGWVKAQRTISALQNSSRPAVGPRSPAHQTPSRDNQGRDKRLAHRIFMPRQPAQKEVSHRTMLERLDKADTVPLAASVRSKQAYSQATATDALQTPAVGRHQGSPFATLPSFAQKKHIPPKSTMTPSFQNVPAIDQVVDASAFFESCDPIFPEDDPGIPIEVNSDFELPSLEELLAL